MVIRKKSIDIRQFIAVEVENHPHDIAAYAADAFGVTPQAVRKHLLAMVEEGTLAASGNTKARRYVLQPLVKQEYTLDTHLLMEDVVLSECVSPHVADLPSNVRSILDIAVSEMINNVIDHSESKTVTVRILRTAALVDVVISDSGVGVFHKIQKAFNLRDERQAILELSKGKLTTAPQQHSGYGIFFTSRMVDIFRMWSGKLCFSHSQDKGDWLIDIHEEGEGTCVSLTVATDSKRNPRSVYDEFCGDPNSDDDLGFHKTHVPLQLAQFGSELLVSRSQAKRVLSRFDRFTEVMLDFKGVEVVGQAFIDEIFRVFKLQHPEIEIVAINENRLVRQLIRLAQATQHQFPK